VRRSIVSVVVFAVAASLAFAAPASAVTRVVTNLPPQQGVVLGDSCDDPVTMTERSERVLTITYGDDGSIVRYDVRGPQTTEFANGSGTITIETTGTATYLRNDDGSWTQTFRGSGPVLVPASDPIGPTLLWFTGTVTSVGGFSDEKALLFTPETQTRAGIGSDVCGMLVTGLKTRH
jgi:hypothetical protein